MNDKGHASPPKFVPKNTKRIEVNNVTHKQRTNPSPKGQFTPLIDTIDNILNVLLDEELIKLPPIIEPKFTNEVPKYFHYEKFYNYHRVPGHLT